jgi:hypothetical protein
VISPSSQAPAPVSQTPSSAARETPVKNPNPVSSKTQAAVAAPRTPAAAAREPLAGTLSVDSRPTGASVFVDDHLVGTTPMLLSQITPGTHSIRLQLDLHHDWKSTVQILGDVKNRVTAALEENESTSGR